MIGIGTLALLNDKCTIFLNLGEKIYTQNYDSLRKKRKVKGESPNKKEKEYRNTNY